MSLISRFYLLAVSCCDSFITFKITSTHANTFDSALNDRVKQNLVSDILNWKIPEEQIQMFIVYFFNFQTGWM